MDPAMDAKAKESPPPSRDRLKAEEPSAKGKTKKPRASHQREGKARKMLKAAAKREKDAAAQQQHDIEANPAAVEADDHGRSKRKMILRPPLLLWRLMTTHSQRVHDA
eukprot:365779-Chlamydomonas_euryale.AAC.5